MERSSLQIDQVKMRSFGWALTQYDLCPHEEEEDIGTQVHPERVPGADRHRQKVAMWKQAETGGMWPQAKESLRPPEL